MNNKPLTIKACYEEMERILKIWLFQKHTKDEEEIFKNSLKMTIEQKGKIEHDNYTKSEQRKAERYAKLYGAR